MTFLACFAVSLAAVSAFTLALAELFDLMFIQEWWL